MLTNSAVDIIVVVFALIAFIDGWRKGAIAAILAAFATLLGLMSGAYLAPTIMSYTQATALRLLLGLGTIILLAGLGNLIGSVLGASLRDGMRFKRTQRVDSALGSIFQAAVALIIAWLVAIPLATSSTSQIANGVRNSAILTEVDKHAPEAVGQLPAQISAMLNESGLPPLISPFQKVHTTEVAAPKIKVDNPELVERLRPSVVHVLADAPQCSRRFSGSGFITAPNTVITNAHVVAGTETVRVETVLGVHEARVVSYNPGEDIAVLHVDELNLPPLPWAPEPALSGEDTIVMGFPESGPFEAAPGRIQDRLTINGPNIYATERTDRETYTVRGTIRQGNSGGPMVDNSGNVLGVVFGASVDNTDTGYVLTAAEVRGSLGDPAALTQPVSTQQCVAGDRPSKATLTH